MAAAGGQAASRGQRMAAVNFVTGADGRSQSVGRVGASIGRVGKRAVRRAVGSVRAAASDV